MPGPMQHQPLSRDQVHVILEGEFTLHHQDCILISIWTDRGWGWGKEMTTYECGRGLVPSNPVFPDAGAGAGSTLDWEWEEYGMR